MGKDKLVKQRAGLVAKAEAMVNDETREFTPDDSAKLDKILARIDALDKLIETMGDDEDQDAETEDEGEDREDDEEGERQAPAVAQKRDKKTPAAAASAEARHNHPAVVRSRGRRSSPSDVAEHAKREGYSIARAATSYAQRGRLTGVEKEYDEDLRHQGYACAGHFKAPFGDVRKLNRRDLTLTTGAGAIPVYTDAQEFIDFLYPKMVGPQLGFRYMNGLMGQTKLPRQSSVPTVTAVAEQVAGAGSAPGIDYVTLNPHTVTANVTISRKFAMQSVKAADSFVMESGSRQVGVQLDQWAISGDGASNRPLGLLNNPAFTQLVIAASNAISFGDTLAMKKLVARANANFGNLGFLTSPAGFAKLAQTPKIGSTFPVFLIDDDDKIAGIPCMQSSQVSDALTFSGASNLTTLLYGNWEMLVVGMFGDGLDVIVDPYTQSKAGDLIITFLLDADTNLLQPGAFSGCPNVGE